MDVLVACERSGRVRDAFLARGHNAISIDLEPTDTPGPHIEGDVRNALTDPWDLVIAFPPCTDLSVVGAKHWREKMTDGRMQAAQDLFMACYNARAPRVCVENPVGRMNTAFRKPDQIIHPYQYGHPWKKRTCLWLRGLPLLLSTRLVEPTGYWVGGGSDYKSRGMVVSDASLDRMNKESTARHRSQTFHGIAQAMADQWG